MGEVRDWEAMEYDCLVNILERVGKISLLLDVPFVCKSWRKASLTPSLWSHIDFSQFWYHELARFSNENGISRFTTLVRLMVSRGQGKSTSFVIPPSCGLKDLETVADKCPELKSLSLKRYYFEKDYFFVSTLIPKWRKLEEFSFGGRIEELLPRVVTEIGKHCENFNSLAVTYCLKNGDSSAIAKHLPKLKKLRLVYCEAEDLRVIVLGCKELEVLEVGCCKYGNNWNG